MASNLITQSQLTGRADALAYTATVRPKGAKNFHEVRDADGAVIATRTSPKRYGFAIVVQITGHESRGVFVGGWASKPRAAGAKMEKYWTVVASVPVQD